MKSPSIVTHSLLVLGLVVFTSCHRPTVETRETQSTNQPPTERVDNSAVTTNATIQQTDTLDSPQRREAIAYAAQRLPIAIQMPVLVLSASLKKNGFTVTQWPTKERTSLLTLVEARNWGAAIDLVANEPVANRRRVDDIFEPSLNASFRPRLAILSPNVKSQYTDDDKENLLDISVLQLPNSPSNFFRINDGFVVPSVPEVKIRGAELAQDHPSRKGYSFIVDGQYTYYVFRDADLSAGSRLVREVGQKYEEEIEALNAKKALGSMSDADLIAQATALASKYMKTVAKVASEL